MKKTDKQREEEFNYLMSITPYAPTTIEEVECTLRKFFSAIASCGSGIDCCKKHNARSKLKQYQDRHMLLLECRQAWSANIDDELREEAKKVLPAWLTTTL